MAQLIEGRVDRGKEHFELSYGEILKEHFDANDGVITPTNLPFPTVALLARVNESDFVYEFTSPPSEEIRKQVLRQLSFFLIEKGEKDPWLYARYHTTTSANVYSTVHWSFCPTQ